MFGVARAHVGLRGGRRVASLLYSAFECWLVAEHVKHGFLGDSDGVVAGQCLVWHTRVGVWGGRGLGRGRPDGDLHSGFYPPTTTTPPHPYPVRAVCCDFLPFCAEQALNQTFAWAVFLGNRLMAICTVGLTAPPPAPPALFAVTSFLSTQSKPSTRHLHGQCS